MADRRDLTPDFVTAAIPPEAGERWIADAQVRGFGLRLWAGPNGGGKAFCLRARTTAGPWTRRQFKPWRDAAPTLDFVDRPEDDLWRVQNDLGPWLNLARAWAEDEKHRLLGRQIRDGHNSLAYRMAGETASGQSLRHHIDWYLADGRGARMSETYRDHILQLVPDYLGPVPDMPIGQITAERLVQAIVQPGRSLANMRRVRNFVSKIVRDPGLENVRHSLGTAENELAFAVALNRDWLEAHDTLKEDFKTVAQRVMNTLKAEPTQIVPAMFLRVYLPTGAKQAPLLRAEWRSIYDGDWYPYDPGTRVTWFEARERLEPELLAELQEYRRTLVAGMSSSPYIFPSCQTGGATPITSVRRYWNRLVRSLDIRTQSGKPVKLRTFANTVRRRNRPSEFADVRHLIEPLRRNDRKASEAALEYFLSKKGSEP